MSTIDYIVSALAGRRGRQLAGPLMRHRASVFMLHREQDDRTGTTGHTPAEVRECVSLLRESGARFVSLRDLVAHGRQYGRFPADAVAFTIDDGFADNENLARAFIAEGVPVTVFLITALMDGSSWPWDDRIAWAIRRSDASSVRATLPDGEWTHSLKSHVDRHAAITSLRNRLKTLSQDDLESVLAGVFQDFHIDVPATPPDSYRPLGWAAARELERLGVDFGPHSVSHRIFSKLDEHNARTEITNSWQRLREELVRPLDIFAWPTGRPQDFTQRDRRLARELGLSAAVATADDYATIDPLAGEDGWYGLRRYSLTSRARHLLQYGSWIARAKQLALGPFKGLTPL